ncbi:hypothetical protein GT348_07290 [Aristophania vespae]|uniref:Bacteriophage Mu Gp45 N-terminal domain-containing protein n=1 Tax=Aristophania vespae TaxID=2697033 RepID=A0A6P1NCM5_9PROT|nr:phage baseplate assembly protein [Aristophania vespae]QHI96066.1 hypothetical protein GT348_07290 [Aristophania vespae]UMM63832.1 hypothetical protein DM15PD_08090 [Aristophania vespae]
MKQLFDIYHSIRSLISHAVVRAIYDDGAEQQLDLNIHAGQTRTRVPVHFPFGFSSHAPLDGAVTHVISTGGDPSDLMALPPSNPAAARLGDLAEGESVLYDSAGQRLIFRDGAVAEIDVVGQLIVQVKGSPILTLDETGISIKGNIHATGDVTTDKTSLNNHIHGGVQAGGAKTTPPQ